MRMKRKAYFTFTKHSQNSIHGVTERHCANANLKWISENKNSLFKEVKMKIGIKKWAYNIPCSRHVLRKQQPLRGCCSL